MPVSLNGSHVGKYNDYFNTLIINDQNPDSKDPDYPQTIFDSMANTCLRLTYLKRGGKSGPLGDIFSGTLGTSVVGSPSFKPKAQRLSPTRVSRRRKSQREETIESALS